MLGRTTVGALLTRRRAITTRPSPTPPKPFVSTRICEQRLVIAARRIGKEREYDKAIADYSDVIRLAPNDAQAYYNRGLVYAAKGDNGNAIADFTAAIGLAPDRAQPYHDRGLAYQRQGDASSAKTDFADAARLGSTSRADCAGPGGRSRSPPRRLSRFCSWRRICGFGRSEVPGER